MLNNLKIWLICLALAISVIVCISWVAGASQCIDDVPGCVNKAGSIRL